MRRDFIVLFLSIVEDFMDKGMLSLAGTSPTRLRLSPTVLWLSLVGLPVLLVGAVAMSFLGASQAQPVVVPHPNHVVVVMEENRASTQIIGSSSTPYINSLAKQGALFTNSHAVTHPSEPNYLALFSGSTQSVTDDSCPHTFAGPDLGGQLISAHKTFSGYSETLPAAGYVGCSFNGLYARKHNPWVNFTDVPASDNLPWTSFPVRYSSLPQVSIVVPNLQDDMHDGTAQQGDAWLKNNIDGYVQWAKTNNSLLIVTWDENDGELGNVISTIFVGPMVKTGQYGENISHYNVLRTLEDMYGLGYANGSASAAAIADCWR
jgi:phosphatidylinositol-3-phosphatase